MGFDERADTWDKLDRRQALADAIAHAIVKKIPLEGSMHLLDVGAGTGLLSRRLKPYVKRITAVDNSAGMLRNLAKNTPEIETVQADILKYRAPETFDGIISSMTLHHIEETETVMKHLRSMLKKGGFIALADLAPERGDFHDNGNEGVYHFGFNEKTIGEAAREAGFANISYDIVYTIEKEGKDRYDIFLLTAKA
ncbi:class I SAM-dependent DNA methyltransferase [Hydrogenimonas sp.]